MTKIFQSLHFPDGETYFPFHMAQARDIEVAGAGTYQWVKFAQAIPLIRDFRHGVDVGANVGLWTRVMARLFSRVTCFEPIPEFARLIPENLNLGDAVAVHRCALGEGEGVLQLRVNPAASAFTHAAPSTDHKEKEARHAKLIGEQSCETVLVPMASLDSFDLPKIDFLKIDVEGFEYFVVKGGEKTIKRDKPVIIVEQKPGNGEQYGLERRAAVDFLLGMGASVAFERSGDFCLVWGSK